MTPHLMNMKTTGTLTAPREVVRPAQLGHYLVFGMLMLAGAFFSLRHLDLFPAPWFDEGWWLQIPKNLALYGQYAVRSAEGFRYFDTTASVSPVFFLPFAGVFSMFGVGLLQARLVMAACFLGCCVLVYLLGRRLHGPAAGLIALALFIFVKPDDNFTSALLMGRQVMAEMPALFFFLAGALVWVHAMERRSLSWSLVCGLLFGVAVTIKNQFALIVIPMLIVLALIDRLRYRQRRLKLFAATLITVLAALVAQQAFLYLLLGPQNYTLLLKDLSAASGPQVRMFFSPPAMLNAAQVIFKNEYAIVLLLSLVYAAWLCLRKSAKDIAPCLPVVFVGGWLLWFGIASVGWARYAFPAFAVSYILAGRALADLGGFAGASWAALKSKWDAGQRKPMLRAGGVLAFIVALISFSSFAMLRNIVSAQDDSPRQFAAYLDAAIPASGRIETWEWEIAFMAGPHEFHHPPTQLLNNLILQKQTGASLLSEPYDLQTAQPQYLIIGPFAKWTQFYSADVLARFERIQSIGEYDLYRAKPAITG